LLDMLRVFSGFPTALCFLFMVILCAYQGGRIALAGFLYARAERRGWPPGIVFGLAFVASELLYPLLFPWYFGASVHNAPVFMQVGDLGGPYAIAAVLLGSNVAIAEIVEARMRSRAPSPRVLAIGFALPVLGLLYGLVRMSMVESAMAAAPVVKVGIAQGNQPLLGRTRALPVHLELTEQLRAQGAELVVWSEGAVPGLYPETAKLDLLRTRVTSKLHVPAIVGAALSRREEGRSKYFNTALLTDETGAVIGRYDKTYLLAFGEYLPLGERFPILYKWSPNSGKFVPGSKLDPVKLGDHVITTMICYEDILPEFVNSLVRAGDPELLVNLTNDAWFGDTSEPWEHLALAKLRAVEHRRYLVRATNSGVSAIVDAVGHVVKHGDTFREETIVGDARYMRSKTLFEITGDAPVWIATILVIAMGFRARKPA
ncbi:MAG TPA: apolipoprotein N-acyltransferase, partial [Byssovorax sp.]